MDCELQLESKYGNESEDRNHCRCVQTEINKIGAPHDRSSYQYDLHGSSWSGDGIERFGCVSKN